MSDRHALTPGMLLLHRLHLLEGDNLDRVRVHVESCAECREMSAAAPGHDWDADGAPGHVPASILARWDRMRDELRGLERAFVRAHLAECAECRQDLELVGHSADLPIVPALELREELATHLASLQDVATLAPPPAARDIELRPPYTIRVVQGTGPVRRAVRERIVQAWALAATIAAAVLAFGGLIPRALAPALRVAVVDTVQDRPSPDSRLALEIVRPPKSLPSATPNGARAPVTRIDISPGEDLMQLTLKNIPAGSNIDIDVFSADGEHIGTRRVDGSALEAGDILRMRALGELAPGSYLLRLRGSAPGDTGTLGSVEYPIQLEHIRF